MTEGWQDPAAAVHPAPVENSNDTQNSRSIVNRLPTELLSYILILVDKFERSSRERIFKGPYPGVQDRATQVCRHWRDVAINTQVLWSYIHVTHPPPHKLAALYISRAGPSSLLDINIGVGSRCQITDAFGESTYVGGEEAFNKTLDSFTTSGASIDRWRSLVIGTSNLELLVQALKVLVAHSIPALQTLSFYWDCLCPSGSSGWAPGNHDGIVQSSLSHLSNVSLPHLRSIELAQVHCALLPRKPTLLSQQLKTLSYTAPTSSDFSASELITVASAYSSLESLSVDVVYTFYTVTRPSKLVPLQSLRSLSIKARDPEAVSQILTSIHTPMLCTLAISVTPTLETPRHVRAGNNPIVHHISSGRVQGDPPNPTSGTVYPQLRELDISEVEFNPDDLAEMFTNLPSVTHLVLSKQQAWSLGRPPWPMPKLESIRFPRGAHEQFSEVLRRRSKAGFPVECIGLTRYWEARIGRDLRSWSRVEVIPGAPGMKHDEELKSDNEGHAPRSLFDHTSEGWPLDWTLDDITPLDFGFVVRNFDYDDLPDPSYEFE